MNRLKHKYHLVILGLFFLTSSCVEKYWPDLNSNINQLLVVDGMISNFAGPYTIKLSYSNSIYDTLFTPVSSAIVILIDNQGTNEVLTESDPGIYNTSSEGIQGVIGNSYKIKIELNNGQIYESDFEELINPVGIDNLYFEEEWQYAQNILETDQLGLQFYVNSKQTDSRKTYLFWEIEETYEYHSNYRIYFLYNGPENNNAFFEGLPIRELANIDTLYYCWKTQILNEILSYGFESVNTNFAEHLPLHFVSFKDERLRWGYNILVRQFTISEQAFTFLESLKKQNESQGGLFTIQPSQIRGNIYNVQNPTEPVLGYFMVASGETTSRIQTKAQGGLRYDIPICYWDTVVGSITHRIENSTEDDWPLFFSYFNFGEEYDDPLLGPALVLNYIAPNCIDCRQLGGTTTKPEFWEW